MTETIQITTLVDNTSNHPTLLAEHGLAFWIEYGQHKLLFDTGASHIIQSNAAILDIDLSQTEAVVLSHGHHDHTGGLMRVLDNAPAAKVYLHPEAIKPKYSCHNNQPCRSIGMPSLTAMNLREENQTLDIHWTTDPHEIVPGLWATGPIPRTTDYEDVGGPFFQDTSQKQPDPLLDDQALFFESYQGLVVVLGCAHAGVINTLDHITRFTGQDEFNTIIGGMHLNSASAQRITKTIEALGIHKIAHIAPAHCTGPKATAKLWNALPDRFRPCSVGTRIEFQSTQSTVAKKFPCHALA